MPKPNKILIAVAILLVAGVNTAFAAPQWTYQRTILPVDTTEDVGTTSTPWDRGFFNDLFITNLGGSGTRCVQVGTDGKLAKAAAACGSGGGGSGGGSSTWATTTSNVPGRLINYPLNSTDIVVIGDSSTTTAPWFYDPNTFFNYIKGKLGIGTTTPANTFAVNGGAYVSGSLTTTNLNATGTATIGTLSGAVSASAGVLSAGTLSIANGGTNNNAAIGASSTLAHSDGTKYVFYKASPADFTTSNISQWTNDSAYLSTVTADSPLSGSGTSGSHLTINTSGTWSGNAGTATALAANGTNCSAGSYALGVDASGNSEGCTVATTGTVTAVSVASANGLAGSSSGGATPQLTLSTTINSAVLKGNGTAISGAVNGTDYTLVTANTCGAGNHFSGVTAAGVFTCSPDTGSGSGTYDFPIIGNATSTAVGFLGGLYSTAASTTIKYASTTAITAQSANIARLDNLTSAGFVKSNAIGTLSVDTNTYLTTAVTSVSGSGGTTGLTLTGGPITTTGTLTLGGTLTVANGGTGAGTLTGCLTGNGTGAITGSGTCNTSNASVSSIATNNGLTGGTITTTGTVGLDLTGITTNNMVLTWNGTKLTATGTNSLAAPFFVATGTTASQFPYASTTAVSGTSLCIGSDCRQAWPSSGGGAYPFPLIGNATSTLTQFKGGLTAFASSTIGNGTATGGLTINGNASTTGTSTLQDTIIGSAGGTPTFLVDYTGNVGVGPTSTPIQALSVQGNTLISGNITSVANVTATGTLTLSALTGTQCLQEINGVVSGAGSACGSGSGGGNSKWATSSIDSASTYNVGLGTVGIGTTTPKGAEFMISTSTGQHIALSDGSATGAVMNIRQIGNSTYFSTSSPTSPYATSSVAALEIRSGAGTSPGLGIGTSTAGTIFSIGGVLNFTFPGSTMYSTLELPSINATSTTASRFLYASSTAITVTGTVYAKVYASLTYATTTWTGTTTIPLGTAFIPEQWNAVQCFTDVGTLNVAFNDGTNYMNYLNASTTVGTVSLYTNNTFVTAEKRYVDIGTPASSPTKISCTVSKQPN